MAKRVCQLKFLNFETVIFCNYSPSSRVEVLPAALMCLGVVACPVCRIVGGRARRSTWRTV
jgi:hypothetical protein